MRILIADDSLLSRRLLEQTLESWGYTVEVACDGTEAWGILSSDDPPRIAILDWMMPGYTGPELCRLAREKGSEPYTYILLLTSRNEREDVVAGLDSGADDYVTKPFDRHELQVRLRAGRRIVELQEQLREQATHDYLTHLWNRSAILEVLGRELSRTSREGGHLGIILADLDHFKSINDTHGHCAGDVALQESARRMQRALREYDWIGRYGGEEFLVVLPGATANEVLARADRMRLAVKATTVRALEADLRISCSFGCTSIAGGGTAAEHLIRTADAALYAAKRAGRDRCVAFEVEKLAATEPVATS